MTHYMIMHRDERRNDIVLCVRCYHEEKKEVQALILVANEWVCEKHYKIVKREWEIERF